MGPMPKKSAQIVVRMESEMREDVGLIAALDSTGDTTCSDVAREYIAAGLKRDRKKLEKARALLKTGQIKPK